MADNRRYDPQKSSRGGSGEGYRSKDTRKNNEGQRQKRAPLSFWGKKKRIIIIKLRRIYLKLRRLPKDIINKISSITIEKQDIYRLLICLGWILFFAMMQTTFFSKFPVFGAVPDLMLPVISAIAITEGATWGGAFGIAAGVIIDSLGSYETTLSPLIFCLVGFFVGLLFENQFSDMPAVRGTVILSVSALRAVITLITAASMEVFVLSEVFMRMIVPEFFATLILAWIPHVLVYLSLKWAHKPRSEKVV